MMLLQLIRALLERLRGQTPARFDFVLPNEKIAANRQFLGTYSDEEIASGKAREFSRSVQLQQQNAAAEARWKDYENKLGMRPGIDGVRVTFKTGPK
jgi:hypothetical protein